MDKKELRKKGIHILKNKFEKDRAEIEETLKSHLIHSQMWKSANTIGITIANGFEWDTKPIIEAAWQEGKTICVPKCQPAKKALVFYKLTSFDQLEVVYYNLLEPKPEETPQVEKKDIDLLIVPGLLFDQNGYRIGFGGGYYDRFLTDFPNNTVSLTSRDQIVENLPSETYDIPVEQIITEEGFIR